jgi:hypothetical protein
MFAPMEPSTRTVNYRRRRVLFLVELICMVGLCGLGYLQRQSSAAAADTAAAAAQPVLEAGVKVKFE